MLSPMAYDEDFSNDNPKGPWVIIGALIVLAAIIVLVINNIPYN